MTGELPIGKFGVVLNAIKSSGMLQESVRCVSPVDGSVYAERPVCSEAEIGDILQTAATAQKSWRQSTLEERAVICSAAVCEPICFKPSSRWAPGEPDTIIAE